MGTLDNIFSKVSNKRTREAQEAALQMVASKKTNHISKSNVVPKSMKQKVEYAKDLSEEVFGDKLQRMELVVDKDRILEYSDKVLENGIVALDTETNGLDRIDGKIAGICLYTPSEKGIYVPVGHISYMTNQPIKHNVDKELMRQIIQEWEDKGVKFILHHAKFDMHILWWMIGVKITPYWDTLIASNLLNENEPHGLKVLWQKYCVEEDEDTKVASFNSLFNGIEFNKIPPEVGYMYASFDPIMTYELYKFQEEYLDKDGRYCYSKGLERVADVFRDIEMPLIPVVFEMECTGVKIDTDLAKELHDKYTFYMDRAERKFKEEIDKISDKFDDLLVKSPDKYNKLFGDGKTISISSPTQLAILFYDVMGFVSKDDKKPRGTGEDIISQFNHPIVEAILEYRAMSKLLSTYIDAIPTHISKRDNKLHATFNQYGAKCITGNSIVPTKDGFKRIDDICANCKEDDVFYPINETIYNKHKSYEHSDYAIKYTNVPTIKITLSCGYTIEGTPNHPILVSNYTKSSLARNNSNKVLRTMWSNSEFKQLRDISIGDIVEVPLGYNINTLDYVKLDTTITHSTNSKDVILPDILDENMALLLGMYHADGTVSDSNGSYSIEIHNADEDVIQEVANLSNNIFNITPYVYRNTKKANEISSYITSINLKQFDYLFSKGARNKKIPECIYESPNSVINSYIKGMTLDSSVYKEGNSIRFTMTVAQEDDAIFLQTYLTSIGIFCSRRENKDMLDKYGWTEWSLSFNSNMYCKFRDLIGFVQSKKIIEDVKTQTLRTTVINNSYKSYVTKIEYNINDVYDIHVPDSHSFIVNGIISHNTGRFSSSNPNLQNIPSQKTKLSDGTVIDAGHDIRQMFMADEGQVIIGGDFS